MGSQRVGHNRSDLALGLPGVENVGKGPLSCDLITSFLLFIYLAALGLHCCKWLSPVAGSRGSSLGVWLLFFQLMGFRAHSLQ